MHRFALGTGGGKPVSSTPAEFVEFINAEYARFSGEIRLARLKVE